MPALCGTNKGPEAKFNFPRDISVILLSTLIERCSHVFPIRFQSPPFRIKWSKSSCFMNCIHLCMHACRQVAPCWFHTAKGDFYGNPLNCTRRIIIYDLKSLLRSDIPHSGPVPCYILYLLFAAYPKLVRVFFYSSGIRNTSTRFSFTSQIRTSVCYMIYNDM